MCDLKYTLVVVYQSDELLACKEEVDSLREKQLTEINVRCKEVDTLKKQLLGQLEALEEDSNSVALQVARLTSDKHNLQEKCAALESTLKASCEQSQSDYSKLLHDKETLEVNVTALSAAVEQLQAGNAALQTQHRKVQR